MINAVDYFQFVPSNPWVCGRVAPARSDYFRNSPLFGEEGIAFIAQAVGRLLPEENALELADGQRIEYDFFSDYNRP